MKKEQVVYLCQQCGFASPRWAGKCPDCQAWNTLQEELIARPSPRVSGRVRSGLTGGESPAPLTALPVSPRERMATFPEADRVLGGGIVRGSVILLAGSPGVGKSTLLLQVAGSVAQQSGKVLYVTGEESIEQTKLRADRLEIQTPDLFLLHEIHLEEVEEHARALQPCLLVVDSIQTLYLDSLSSSPGSVTQVRECAGRLQRFAKETGTAVILVGHVTKDGGVAGPMVLEHVVDAVLYLEGEGQERGLSSGQSLFRILRGMKNRFGPTHEIGVFQMEGGGLREVSDVSAQFLLERTIQRPGAVIVPLMEGNRPLLVELQSLVSRSYYGIPKRSVTGVDFNRLSLILAVLEKRGGINLGQCDVFVNAVGALRIKEPAADLGMALATFSSFREFLFRPGWVALGEVGLGGEIRPVPFLEQRLKEAASLGFSGALVPRASLKQTGLNVSLEVRAVGEIREALEFVAQGKERFKGRLSDRVTCDSPEDSSEERR